jgi:1-acyl-sn-glycerol-3-phosphate acyltransferase
MKKVSRIRAAWRLIRVFAHIIHGSYIIGIRFRGLDAKGREREVQRWQHALLRHIGIALEVQGLVDVPGIGHDRDLLVVSNHISWLDIVSLHAARYCRFVSKADVKRWPFIGALASGAGTLFIERASRRDAMRVVHHMAESLKMGDRIAVFPEGTTSDGSDVQPFHANLLQAAISIDAPVQPVGLSYIDGATGQRSLVPAYIGNDTLFGSVWRTARAQGLVVRIVFGEPQKAQGRDRREWAEALRAEIIRLRSS